ncbi:hypothetical protein ACFOHT_05970 [Massilia oculi]|uniref:hypothetical protein n=1 Tax=Massilia oculi TaxID=945844 RepID=UPI0013B36DFB|nr:hypothetical protein [Massilia oculi]
MINFTEGKISLGEESISVASDYKDLIILADEGFIEKPEDAGGIYYCADCLAHDMRFGIFISLKEKRIGYIALPWLHGPCTSIGWGDVSEKALKKEYCMLSKFLEESVGRLSDNKKYAVYVALHVRRQVDVSYELREFVTQIYIEPR